MYKLTLVLGFFGLLETIRPRTRKNIRLASYENGQLAKEVYFSKKMCYSSSCTMRQQVPSFDTIYTTSSTNQISTYTTMDSLINSETGPNTGSNSSSDKQVIYNSDSSSDESTDSEVILVFSIFQSNLICI